MALKTLKLARRSVNLADCTKGDPICDDVTDCEPIGTVSSPCCPDNLLLATLDAVLNIDDGSFGVTNKHVAIHYLPGVAQWWSGTGLCTGIGLSQPPDSPCLVSIGGGYWAAAFAKCGTPPPTFQIGFSIWEQPGGPGTNYSHVFSRGWFVNDGQVPVFACSPLSISYTWAPVGGSSQVEMTVTG